MFLRVFRFIIVLLFISSAIYGTGIKIDSFEIINSSGGKLKVHVDYTAFGLNTPIPESDEVHVKIEVKKDNGGVYSQLPSWFNYMKNCNVDASNNCIDKGKEIKTYQLGFNVIRAPSVWRRYGGLGEWEKNAPNSVKGSIDGVIPIEYEGAQARLIVTLRHVIGGPYAAWAGISYYHAIEPITIPYKIENNQDSYKNNIGIDNKISKKLEVLVYAKCKEYRDAMQFFDIEDSSKISKIIIKGVIKDYKNNPLKDCQISAEANSNEISLKSKKNGEYKIVINLSNNKKGIDLENIDFFMEEKDINLVTKILEKPTLIANGKLYKLKVKFLNNNKAYANKELYLNYPANIKAYKDKKEVNYIEIPNWFEFIKTNNQGIAYILIKAPKSRKEILNRVLNANRFFPVNVSINVYRDKNGNTRRVGRLNLSWQSPYPKIKKALIPGNLEAQHWQLIPSKIYIEDLDSSSFKVEVFANGKLKTKGGKIYKNYLKIDNISKIPVEFYYASFPIGLNLNNQIDLAQALKNATKESALNFALTLLEGFKINEESKNLIRSLYLGKLSLDTISIDTINNTSYNSKGIKDADIAVGGILGLADFAVLIKGKGFSLNTSLYIEFAKTLYAYSKSIIDTYYQAKKIENSYLDVIFIPVLIKVTDSDGYQSAVLKKCSVRFYKGE